MKYNVNLDKRDSNTSHWKILSQITPHSVVLECGCASGYMTRYMKEELQCDVYIVEYDKDAFEIAKQYATDGLVADLMESEWFDKFSGIKFDYVLFADVLEHLRDPLKVLRMAYKLLKYDGRMIVSLPNVGHNDIILKLLSGRWEYTPNGLLDDTHIRFWGIYDLEPFFREAMLGIEKFDATYTPVFNTEQYLGSDQTEILKFDQVIPQLNRRRVGEILQFILVLRKQEYMDEHEIAISPCLPAQNTKGATMASVYFNRGQGYSEKDSEKFFLTKGVSQKLQIAIPAGVHAVRFDPIENLCCAIKNIRAQSLDSSVECAVELLNAYPCGEYSFFFTNDPQILIVFSQLQGGFVLEISMDIFPFTEMAKDLFKEALFLKDRQMEERRQTFEQQKQEMNEMYNTEKEKVAEQKLTMQEQEQQLQHMQSIYQSLLEAYERQATNSNETIAAAQRNMESLILENSRMRVQMQQASEQLAQEKENAFEQKAELQKRDKELDVERKNVQVLQAQVQQISEQLAQEKENAIEQKTELQVAQESMQRLRTEQAVLLQEIQNHTEQARLLGQKLTEAHNQSAALHLAYDKLMESYNSVLQSDSWRVTMPLRRISAGVRNVAQRNRFASLGWRGLISLKQNGVKATYLKMLAHFNKKPQNEMPLLQTEAVYEENIDFSRYQTDIKTLALYLPQYHEFEENNQWWGKGFTEWTNVRKGYSRFENHYQPRVPDKAIGYYDLTDVENLKKQVCLAKQHGIYGFAIYYYWFSGKRLMEKPMDMLLEHKEIDFPFMAVWANENWTRTWDGQANHVLIAQEYSDKDPRQFILDLKKYIDDPRYIRVSGKPVIGLYDPLPIPNVAEVLAKWRETAREVGIGEILIWVCQCNSNAQVMGVEDIVDGEYEFPPRGKGNVPNCEVPSQGIAYNYQALVECERYYDVSDRKIPVYRGSMMQWDNSARRKSRYNCWINYTPELFYLWNKTEVADLRRRLPQDQRFLFVNAWNEWGEGTYLEPDEKYGYANINALSKAIFDLPMDYGQENRKKSANENTSSFQLNGTLKRSSVLYIGGGLPIRTKKNWNRHLRKECQIAVQAHIFYTDLAPEITEKTNNIPFPFDLYVSTDSEEKAAELRDYFGKHSKARNVYVQVFDNRGRDVTPFIRQMQPVIEKYKYFCHIHSKKSLHSNTGNIWREYLYENLLGSAEIVSEIMYLLENDDKLGVVFPENLDVLRPFVEWGSNRGIAQGLCGRMGMYEALPEQIHFPAGNMFWGRVRAVMNLFQIDYTDSDFPTEGDQVDGTTMHAIERLWLYTAAVNGYTYQETRSVFDNRPLL